MSAGSPVACAGARVPHCLCSLACPHPRAPAATVSMHTDAPPSCPVGCSLPPSLAQNTSAYHMYEFIDCAAILESCTVLSKPKQPIQPDMGLIEDDDRLMWLHTVGHSALGEG